MDDQEYREIRAEIPEDVYARYGGASGASDSYLLVLIVHELRALRRDLDQVWTEVRDHAQGG